MSGVVSRLGKEIADINTEKARINQLIKDWELVADCTNCGESVQLMLGLIYCKV